LNEEISHAAYSGLDFYWQENVWIEASVKFVLEHRNK
jgi:hypothetical protein